MQITPTSVSVDVEVERNNTHVQAKTLRPVQKEVCPPILVDGFHDLH